MFIDLFTSFMQLCRTEHYFHYICSFKIAKVLYTNQSWYSDQLCCVCFVLFSKKHKPHDYIFFLLYIVV